MPTTTPPTLGGTSMSPNSPFNSQSQNPFYQSALMKMYSQNAPTMYSTGYPNMPRMGG